MSAETIHLVELEAHVHGLSEESNGTYEVKLKYTVPNPDGGTPLTKYATLVTDDLAGIQVGADLHLCLELRP